jgi:predicted CXXCH cytochrome family protein
MTDTEYGHTGSSCKQGIGRNYCRILIVIALIGLAAACEKAPSPANTAISNGFVGAATCATCHTAEAERWQGSHHALAMQPATSATVLGDFSDARFVHNGVTSRFFRRENNFFVETDGEDGKLSVFPVRYTFGVTPLQQYLVEVPSGKIQALGIAWDSRSADAGGQRWFHVYGDDPIDHTDVLHWTQFSANWETMCADCHSTNLLSKYDLKQDRFETTWDELNVSCEACHGLGGKHVAWARDNPAGKKPRHAGFDLSFDERRNVVWQLNTTTGNSQRSKERTTDTELNACAGCHSRRSRIAEGNNPVTRYLDNYMPALIDPPLYHADGQMLDEVFVHGSFLQSRMHQAGVTCSDCHDPHSLKLRAPGSAVCLRCHSADKFNTVKHQIHAPDTINCIDCHMPATTYMQNDSRHDHSFPIPRPELSVAYGVPNACNKCHTDKDARWAVSLLENAGRITPGAAERHWTGRLAAATASRSYAKSMGPLQELAADPALPAIIRGTAAGRLQLGDAPDTRALFSKLTSSPEPLLRLGAGNALQNSDPALAAAFAPILLNDPVRAVRISAVQALAGIDPALLPTGSNPHMQNATAEYISAQEINNDRPESHVNIGNLRRIQGRFELAEPAYQQALMLNPGFVPAYANLADLYREQKRESEAEATLRKGLSVIPSDIYLHHALGLSLVRQNRFNDALPELRIAANSPDAEPRFALVYALALDRVGGTTDAIGYLELALQRFEGNQELESALQEISDRN